jgi:hypothetical protein
MLKQSIKIYWCGKSGGVAPATAPDLPHQSILIDCFNIVTLASSYSAPTDDGNYTETSWSLMWFTPAVLE